jgi:erythromycin esterase-like protein
MQPTPRSEAAVALQQAARPLTGAANDYDPLMDLIGDARFVLLGAASYGTHEFYAARARITRRLIEEKDFVAVSVDADWSGACRVGRYVRGVGHDEDAPAALDDFRPFPSWIWRNTPVLDFVDWLKQHNRDGDPGWPKAGFYGLDLYNSTNAIRAVVRYLDQIDPAAARRARERYARSDSFGDNAPTDRDASGLDRDRSLEDEVVAHLLQRWHAAEPVEPLGRLDPDDAFYAAQAALLAPNADRYYRKMFGGRAGWWNLRNRHMVEMLEDLAEHLGQSGGPAKVVVWAHNRHLGDARATEVGRQGGLNVGQILRQRYGRDVVLVGFTTYTGTVTAASDWDAPAGPRCLDPALPDSYESLFHDTGQPRFLLPSGSSGAVTDFLRQERLERSIGVVYVPESERFASYFHARLPEQFDAVLHFDRTTAVQPVDAAPESAMTEVPYRIPADT